jgi:hypothetical protein
MLLPCPQIKAVFPAERLRLRNLEPTQLLWDRHHGSPFLVKVGGLEVQALGEEAPTASIRLEIGLSPPEKLVRELEVFGASMGLTLAPLAGPPQELREKPVLAACHIPGPKLFVFCEDSELKARPQAHTLELIIGGSFKARRLPCQEADFLMYLEPSASARLLSCLLTLARQRL